MAIEKILNKYKKSAEQPNEVWANTEMDKLRRKECLCLNCDRKSEEVPYSSCPVAKAIYDISVKNNMAVAVTRCGATDSEGNLLYLHLR